MPFDFPASPTTGQVFNAPTGQGYVYSGTAWNLAQTSPQAPVASDNPPANPYNGQLWLRSTTGALYCWYADPNSSQWIQIPGVIAATAPQAWELIGDFSFSAVASFPVINLSPFRKLRLTGMVAPSAAGGLLLKISNNNGGSFDSGSNYTFQHWYMTGATATAVGGTTTQFSLTSGPAMDATTYAAFDTLIEGFAGTTVAACKHLTRTSLGSGTLYMTQQTGSYAALTGRNAIQLSASSGTITGTLTVEGLRG
jgi:hypothetical protein